MLLSVLPTLMLWLNPVSAAAAATRSPQTPAPPVGPLQQTAPPPAVQQLQQALAGHQPRIAIVAPRDGTLLENGPQRLTIRVGDWPLVVAGPLGLGPHLAVQIDDQPPLRLTAAGPSLQDGVSVVEAEIPPLPPGSHRITAYAALPWGEAARNPGGLQQIRVHRLAANPLALPAPGSAQLLPVSQVGPSLQEPVLLDWILLDAPLQNLRPGDDSWRLRVTVNGDSFLVDHNLPLWLRGWRPGENSLLLELVDGRGEPLNPPFNSHVSAVTLAGPGSDAADVPRWLQGPLSEQELAQLLGQQPPPAPQPETKPPAEPEPQPEPQPEPEPEPEPEPQPQPQPQQQSASPEQPSPNASASERIGPGTALEGSARELVNSDGSLIQSQPSGALAALRQRLTR